MYERPPAPLGPHFWRMVRRLNLYLEGLSDAKLAELEGVGRSSIRNWRWRAGLDPANRNISPRAKAMLSLLEDEKRRREHLTRKEKTRTRRQVTAQEAIIIEQMWLSGAHSGEIAKHLGLKRNTVAARTVRIARTPEAEAIAKARAIRSRRKPWRYTKADCDRAIELRKQGLTYKEIGNIMGKAFGAIHLLIGRKDIYNNRPDTLEDIND